jgi:hypothetical protein
MTGVTVRPALWQDMALHECAQWPLGWPALQDMFRNGSVWRLDADGQAAALFGIYPLSLDAAEVWLEVFAAAGPHVVPLLGKARLTLDSLPYRRLIVPEPTRAGAVLARRLGFRPIDGFFVKERTD